ASAVVGEVDQAAAQEALGVERDLDRELAARGCVRRRGERDARSRSRGGWRLERRPLLQEGRRRADRRLGAAREFLHARLGTGEVSHHARGDEQHDLGLVARVLVRAEETPEERQVAEPGDLVRVLAVLVADEAGENLRLAVLEAQ